MTIQRTLHDRLFKEFLQRFLPEFLTLFFPAEAARLDFSTLTFPAQELMVNLPQQVLRITDVVAEVHTLAGEPEVIIVHVEIEANEPKPLPQRMFDYYALLRILRRVPVLPIALVLAPGVGGLNWRTYTERLFGRELVRFRYGQVGLLGLHSEAYLILHNPVAATLAALMKPEQESNATIKLEALRTVVASDLTESDKLFLINIVETYLPRYTVYDAREEVMQALADMEMSWLEKVTHEAQEEGMRTLLRSQLTWKFGDLPSAWLERFNAIRDPAVFADLSKQLLTAQTLDEIVLPEPQ